MPIWPAFARKTYPSPVQIVFGVDDPADPAFAVVHRLVADFPDRDLDAGDQCAAAMAGTARFRI